jgi:Zn-dependent protease with chaperone function
MPDKELSTMDNPDFRRMVADYEHTSRHQPRRFALVTAGFAAFGYASILGTLVLAAVALKWGGSRLLDGRFSLGLVFLVVGCVSLLWSLLRALWSRQQPPEGMVVTHKEAPRLFELIDQVRRKVGAPKPDVVLLDGELNAAIVQHPRLGLLGWHRNHLILGVPTLMALDVKQLAAVIAHEFGHLQGAHGKLGAWVYRTRRSWWLLAESRSRSKLGAWWADAALALFFKHFFPRFNARAFVLSRQQEYEADRVAHAVAGTQASAESLVSLSVQGRFLAERFWPDVYAAAANSATPEVEPYRLLHKRLRGALGHADAPGWLRDALKSLPDVADTHPSLRERLDFANQKPQLPTTAPVSAAETLLRDAYPSWLRRLDERWKAKVAERWGEMHRRQQAQRQLAQEYEAERAQAPLAPDDHLLWARAVRLTGGPTAEAAVLRRLLQDHPGQAQGRFELAVTLIDAANVPAQTEGATLLRELAEGPPHELGVLAARRYERWLEATERFNDLKLWRERLRTLEQRAEAAWETLHDFNGRQFFEAPDFSKRVLKPLVDMLRRESAVGRAFLVRKPAHTVPGWRFCMLVIERSRGSLGQPDAADWWEHLRERVQLPCACMVIDLAHPFWKSSERAPLVQQITQTPGACIYTGRKL